MVFLAVLQVATPKSRFVPSSLRQLCGSQSPGSGDDAQDPALSLALSLSLSLSLSL